MNIDELLTRLRSADVILDLDGDELCVNAPRDAIDAGLKDLLARNKTAIIDALRQAKRASTLTAPPMKPLPPGRDCPVSFAQERLWFLDQLEPGNAFYNMPLSIRIEGAVSVPALSKSLHAIVNRHQSLRTRFVSIDGVPHQVIDDVSRFDLVQQDLGDIPAELRQAELLDRARDEAIQPFDLARDCLFRAKLLRVADSDHVLLLTMHHIISDGWSMSVLFRELGSCYEAFRAGREPEFTDLPIQYTDFAVWQRNWMSGDVLESQLAYWRRQLDGVSRLELPTDRPRPRVQTFNGAVVQHRFPDKLAADLEKLSQRHGVSLFMAFLTAFAVLLSRYSGQQDIVVGSPIANRNRAQLESLIGIFVNSLVMRIDVSGNPAFTGLLKRVHDTAFGAYEHQDLPFEKLVDEIEPERNLARNPLFQVMFALQNAPRESLHLEGLSLKPSSSEIQTTRFDLEFHIWQWEGSVRVNLIYNTDLFDAATMERLLGHYQSLLETMVASPLTRIADAPMLGGAEREQLLVDWNRTRTDYPREATVAALFEAQAAATPDAVALDFDGQRLSYGELNARANRLAHYLRALGVGAQEKVGLFVERDADMVIALLGVLKAGGAYLPVDLDYPAPRIAFMLDDAQAPVLLTTAALEPRLPEGSYRTVCLDRDRAEIVRQSADNPEPMTSADSLAYVIYTSGSTGTPKGVEICQRSINRLVRNTDYYQADASDRIAQASSVSFDAATFEIWGALLNGARLVGVSKAVLLNPNALAGLLEDKGVTAMFVTTAVFNQIARERPDAFRGLEAVMFGGEAVDAGAVRWVLGSDPPRRLLHVYGPTESTTFASWYPIESLDEAATTVPIGRALANTTLYVLDANREPVPVGVSGELYIGGDGLARGYLNRPELTAEKFVENPFVAGERLYRSGDKVRYLADGSIEFQGRFDHQVKLRGFRIELGEIETALQQHEAVQDAVALVREDEPGDRRIAAYLVPAPGWLEEAQSRLQGDADEALYQELIPGLRQALRRQLPEYMLPSAYVLLDAMPLNPNGKVERDALPAPDDLRASLGAEYTAPRNELQQCLADIWAEVLKLDRVGIHDNFFDLGGHSLMATQVVSRIRTQLRVELPLAEMFGYPTVAELATVTQALPGNADSAEADVIPRADRSRPLPASFAQQRLWFLDQLDPGGSAYNQSLALRLKGELSVAALTDSLARIVARQEGLRTHFALHRGKPVQVIDASGVELARDDLSALAPQERERELKARIRQQASRPFELDRGPLFRCRLFRLAAHEHVLLLNLHHIISDGWSLGVLFRELGDCYAALSKGDEPDLSELPVQYADFALWQQDWLSGEVLAGQLDYWRHKLRDLATLDLPTDRPRPALQSYSGDMQALTIDADLNHRLSALSKQYGATQFMIYLAAFTLLMHRYSGQQDIVIGTPIANRKRSELEGLIGFFVNMLVMRLQLNGDAGFDELLEQVQRTALEAFQHQDIPFEKLVEVLQPERDRSRNPLFQVQFALQNAPMSALELQGLTLEPVSGESRTTRFDLECHLWPRGSELHVSIIYNTELFDAGTIQRMLGHYRNLLAALVREPRRAIDSLPMLDAAELELLGRWNQATSNHDSAQTLAELFCARAARNPDAVAVQLSGERLSYAELEARSNQLARYLRARGVGPEVLVGLYLERSLDLLVAILGTLKAGGAYVPMDPEYPRERLEFMLTDCAAPVLLTQRELQPELPDFAGQLVRLDADWPEIGQQASDALTIEVEADNAAYVIYTSGSTGQPKGVVVTHANVTRLFASTREWFGFDERDVWTLFHSSAFDFSVWEIWGALLHGGRLVVVPYDVSRSPELFHELLVETGVTVLNQTPSAFRQLAEADLHDSSRPLETLRYVIFGGEALDPRSLGPWFEKHGDRAPQLINMYGITETTVHVSYRPLSATEADHGTSVIGRALPDLQICILDRHLQPQPVGVPGELYIGGAGLARGYLNRPELTEERFIADPFSETPGARLYRTGDLGRYLADGDIEYLGRCDQQVKLRGFRIELGEIESVLVQHEAVNEAVVLCRDDGTGESRLVAWVTARAGRQISIGDLRGLLRNRLPEYMVPSVIVELQQLPLTANGKLDRKALPEPDDARRSDADYVAPRNELERELARTWAEVLKLERVGIHDNFFDLGGHSLKLVELHRMLGDRIETPLTLVDLFAQPTVSALVEHLSKPQSAAGARPGEPGRDANLKAGSRRLQRLRQSRKRDAGIQG